MTQHIGIVGCSAPGAALCYSTICSEGAELLGPHAHPEVTMHTPSLADVGADFLICPDNTIHQALPEFESRSPLPWLHIAEVVAAEAVERNFRCLLLTGTKWLVDGEVYPDKLSARGLEFVRPDEEERNEMSRIIMDELVCGIFKPEAVTFFQRVIEQSKASGCDAAILGCTEIPLIIDDKNSALPTLDSTRLLARAALRRATNPD